MQTEYEVTHRRRVKRPPPIQPKSKKPRLRDRDTHKTTKKWRSLIICHHFVSAGLKPWGLFRNPPMIRRASYLSMFSLLGRGGGNQIRNQIPPLAIMSVHHDSPWTIHATSPEDTTQERKTWEIRSYLGLYRLTTCTKPYHSNSACITTGWGPVSGCVNSKWNMATII